MPFNPDREFLVYFEPKTDYYQKKRFVVTPSKLYKYVGHYNAKRAILRAYNSQLDYYRVKLRTYGIIDFYVK